MSIAPQIATHALIKFELFIIPPRFPFVSKPGAGALAIVRSARRYAMPGMSFGLCGKPASGKDKRSSSPPQLLERQNWMSSLMQHSAD